MHGDSQEVLSLPLFHFFPLIACTPHSSTLCTSYSFSHSCSGLSGPPLSSSSPSFPRLSLSLSLPSAAVTQFKVTSSHRLQGSPLLLTYFYWLMQCSNMQNRHTCKTDIHAHAYMYSLQSNCIQMQKDATFLHIQVLFCYHEILFALSKTFTHTDVRTVNEAASRCFFPHNLCFYSKLCRFSCLLPTLKR